MNSAESIFEPLIDGFTIVDGAVESSIGYGIVPIAASLAALGGIIYLVRKGVNKITTSN